MEQLTLDRMIEVLRGMDASVESRGLTLASFLNSASRGTGTRTLVTMTSADGYVVHFAKTTLLDRIDEFGIRRTEMDTSEFDIDLSPTPGRCNEDG